MTRRVWLVLIGLAMSAACYNMPTQVAGMTGPSGATVTITSAGAAPASVTIAVGQSVTFVNNDSVSHDIEANPGQSSDCTAIGGVAVLGAGQTRLTIAFTSAGSCTFYDYSQPLNNALQGAITAH